MTAPAPPLQDEEPRCWRCGLKLAERLARPWWITCRRCHAKNLQGLGERLTPRPRYA